jgi:DNA (cytosine-5)-methyltransferase 1
MTHGSLFSGIGGFDLAAEWMGWENVFHCEFNPYCQKILKQNFPQSIPHGDITTTDFTVYRNRIDILTGGFPCQPVSNIGLQLGDSDPRYHWPAFRRAYRECNPVWIVPENVHGLVTWNDGKLFGQICADMEADGYEVSPYVLPASGVGAGHQRKRVWVVAYSAQRRLERGQHSGQERHRQTAYRPVQALVEDRNWTEYAASFIHRGVYGLPDRVDRTAALGNAIVPQVALQIFKAIELYEILY